MADAGVQVVIGTSLTASTALQSFASDGAFVAAKGSAAAAGDIYYNTTENAFRAYQGSAWGFLRRGPLLSYASDAAYVTAKGSAAAAGDEYYNSSEGAVRKYDGAWFTAFKTNGSPGTSFVGLSAATTTNANDSIRILASDGSAFSADAHQGYVCLPSTTAGRLSVFLVSASATINLTGAHWGLGTLGDFTDVELRVYAINDNGTLKWGVSNQGRYRTIVDTDTSTTATNITTQPKMLVNSALSSGTWPCHEIGWFNASFDDTGGAAEDLWAVATTVGKINVGIPCPTVTDWSSYTPTGTWATNVTWTGITRRVGDTEYYAVRAACSGAPTGNCTVNTRSGRIIDTTKISSTNQMVGESNAIDGGASQYPGKVLYNSTTSVVAGSLNAAGTYAVFNTTNATVPITFGNTDSVEFLFAVPIRGWSN